MASYKIKIDDGRVPITIDNERDEELGVVYINPNDFNILDRLDKVKKNIADYKVDEKENITTDRVKELDKLMREQVDYLFDYNVTDMVFKNQHSLSTLQGVTFVERLINALTPVIKQIVEKETENSAKRMSKYIAPYVQDHKSKSGNVVPYVQDHKNKSGK